MTEERGIKAGNRPSLFNATCTTHNKKCPQDNQLLTNCWHCTYVFIEWTSGEKQLRRLPSHPTLGGPLCFSWTVLTNRLPSYQTLDGPLCFSWAVFTNRLPSYLTLGGPQCFGWAVVTNRSPSYLTRGGLQCFSWGILRLFVAMVCTQATFVSNAGRTSEFLAEVFSNQYKTNKQTKTKKTKKERSRQNDKLTSVPLHQHLASCVVGDVDSLKVITQRVSLFCHNHHKMWHKH